MATAAQRVLERIPGKDDEHGAGGKYAYVELEARNVDEFEKLRAEAAASPAFTRYDFEGTMGRKVAGATSGDADKVAVVKAAAKAAAKKTPTLTAEQKAQLTGETTTDPTSAAPAESTSTEEAGVSEPTSDEDTAASAEAEKLSPRDIARQRLLARKKGA